LHLPPPFSQWGTQSTLSTLYDVYVLDLILDISTSGIQIFFNDDIEMLLCII
jgi:hypothetical protein